MFAKSRADISAKPVRVICDMGGFLWLQVKVG